MKEDQLTREIIAGKYSVCQSKKSYRYNEDSFHLAAFSRLKPDMRVLDIGTGCGIIPILLLTRQPQLEIVAVEMQKELFDLAKKNITDNHIQSISVHHKDVMEIHKDWENQFDLVISNPPYYPLESGRSSPNPVINKAKQEVLLSLSGLFQKASELVLPDGSFVGVYPVKRLNEVILQGEKWGFRPLRLQFIHGGKKMPARAFLFEMGKKVGQGHFCVEPPLIQSK